MSEPKITTYPDTGRAIVEALRRQGWHRSTAPGGRTVLARYLMDGSEQTLITDGGPHDTESPTEWCDRILVITVDDHAEPLGEPLRGTLADLYEAHKLDEPAPEPLELLAALRHMEDAAARVLEAAEKAERVDQRIADAFAFLYPFRDDFAEVPGQIGTWRRDIAERIHAPRRWPL